MITQTVNSGQIRYFDSEGKEVFPCRCGETNQGEYASYAYGHHNCLHGMDLVAIGENHVMCLLCGMTWGIDDG